MTPLSSLDGLQAARSRAAVAPADWSSRFELTGPDRIKVLDGQCTQSIVRRSVGEGGYGFVLEPKGAVVSDLEFLVLQDRLQLDVPRSHGAGLSSWLTKFLMLSDAELVDRDAETFGALVLGPDAPAALERVTGTSWGGPEGTGGETAIGGAAVVIRTDETCGVPGFRLKGAISDHSQVLNALELPEISDEVCEVLRVEAGRPRFGVDLDASVLPKETGQEARAVDYEKGCYCGQEVVARQHFIGKARKSLVGLVTGAEAAVGMSVRDDAGQDLGTLSSVAHSPGREGTLALAVLKGAEHAVGAIHRLITQEGRDAGQAEIAALPFVT